MSELEKLKAYLDNHGYNNHYRHIWPRELLISNEHKPDQIIVYENDIRSWDVICHEGSYGGDQGLLELYGSLCDDVIGWLTAQDVIDILEGKKEV